MMYHVSYIQMFMQILFYLFQLSLFIHLMWIHTTQNYFYIHERCASCVRLIFSNLPLIWIDIIFCAHVNISHNDVVFSSSCKSILSKEHYTAHLFSPWWSFPLMCGNVALVYCTSIPFFLTNANSAGIPGGDTFNI